jgi:hypothetical protein
MALGDPLPNDPNAPIDPIQQALESDFFQRLLSTPWDSNFGSQDLSRYDTKNQRMGALKNYFNQNYFKGGLDRIDAYDGTDDQKMAMREEFERSVGDSSGFRDKQYQDYANKYWQNRAVSKPYQPQRRTGTSRPNDYINRVRGSIY